MVLFKKDGFWAMKKIKTLGFADLFTLNEEENQVSIS